jgi:predicted RNase H-like nuclease (RuvC/YqgF family)
MAQLERLEQGIVALDSELNLALKEGDQNKIESLEREMAVLADAYRRTKAQPQELEKRLNQQAEATDLLSKGAYKKPIEKREYFPAGPVVGGNL